MRGSLKAYKKVSIDSQLTAASPHKVIELLLSGAIERIIQAKVAVQQRNTPLKCERLGKALDIIISLRSCLSLESGGDIAKNLDALYDFIIMQLVKANRSNAIAPLDDAVGILIELKAAWQQIPIEFHHISQEQS